MPDASPSWVALCGLVFLFGLRHGFDADHLATIDALTRLNQRRGLTVARWCGVLFSLGHGVVVMTIAITVSAWSAHATLPAGLDAFGACVSIAFLIGLGLANIRAAWRTPAHVPTSLVGIRSRWFARFLTARTPLGVAAIGALFAISFDTISQSLLFAAAALQFGGVGRAASLGALFVVGMVVTDGVNGWWIARLVARADARAAFASRAMGATVGIVSLGVAALGIVRFAWPTLDRRLDGAELALGAAVVATMLVGYAIARFGTRAARERSPITSAPRA
jgi:nickel/cobalt transporter (NiCoT) family protein